jgi:hypothetical protein
VNHRTPGWAPVFGEGDNWDIYALVRRQSKSVDMIVIPGGARALSRPGERMISLRGNVDWYRLWLKGEQRALLPSETEAKFGGPVSALESTVELKGAVDRKSGCVRTVGARSWVEFAFRLDACHRKSVSQRSTCPSANPCRVVVSVGHLPNNEHVKLVLSIWRP